MDKRCESASGRRNTRGAFTLIELLLVLVILAVLAAVVVPKFTSRSEQAKVTAAKADVANLGLALDTYEIENGGFPTEDQGLQALITNLASSPEWRGPYIKGGLPMDPWGRPYVYRYPGAHNNNGYDLSSLGPDGQEGADDVTNWSRQ
jgi:general secretion pathway protein G